MFAVVDVGFDAKIANIVYICVKKKKKRTWQSKSAVIRWGEKL